MDSYQEQAGKNLALVRERKPLVHNITNFVVMNSTANALLAMGASPIMAHSPEEVEELVGIAGALVLNIGTLTPYWIESMEIAGRRARSLKIPIILDPVGSGATRLRTEASQRLISAAAPTVIRGNASEVLSLAKKGSKTKGVDSIHSVDDAAESSRILARELGCTLAITGPVDLITDGKREARVSNGHPMMGYVTGTGCAATTTIAAFLAVDKDPVSATSTALALFGLAGEVAAETSTAPGGFWIAMLDALYTITPEQLTKRSKMEIING
jgi:hydroxyethylthiazole kinase